MKIGEAVGRYTASRSACIPLVASENSVSRAVRKLCASPVSERYCVGPAAPWRYPRESYLEEITNRTNELGARLFGGLCATAAPLSGSQCVAAIMLGFCAPGDLVMGIGAADGGHWALHSIAERMRCDFEPLPLAGLATVDVEKFARLINKRRPKLVMVDPSHSLEAIEPEQIRAVLPPEIPLFYDLSHFLGLVPHRYLPNPFGRGVTVIHGSTHKSFFGPQKGMIIFSPTAPADMIAQIRIAAEKILSSNTHLHHVAALGQALEEYEAYGREYAPAVVGHACLFAQTLSGRGMDVLSARRAFTESHQVHVRLGGAAESVWQFLTTAGILTNLVRLPRDNRLGLRFGLAEITRRGYSPAEVVEIANLIADLIGGTENPKHAEERVRAVALRVRPMKYCFHDDGD
jgi:glycine hydroxymethyltransferase